MRVILALQSSDAVHGGVDNLGCGSTCWAFVVTMVPLLLSLSLTVIFLCLLTGCFIIGVLIWFGLLWSKDMLMMVWFLTVGFENSIGSVMMLLMRLLILVVGGLEMLSLTLVVIFLVSVVGGIPLLLIFIGSSCHFQGCC